MPPLSRDSDSTAMIIRRWHKSPHTVTLSFTVASTVGKPPIVGFSKDVEKVWKGLVHKHMPKQHSSSQLSEITSMEKFEQKEKLKDVVSEANTNDESTIELAVHLIRSEQNISTA
ncbi:hypothetical protein GCK32_002321 [Trichostrongylus colubriformis]|uniref:Uncharacterized protein n=1 Tax=Trichostrongylus colubriformis TaxID=6319 RepID=A0AAN8FPQ1_TRICO